MLSCARITFRGCRSGVSTSIRSYNFLAMQSTTDNPSIRKGDTEQNNKKRQSHGGRGPKRQRTKKEKPIQEGSSQEVLLADVRALFQAQSLSSSKKEALLS